MKKYATFTTSEAVVVCQLTISNRIIEREKDINCGSKIIGIINIWLDKIHTEFGIETWNVGINKNNDIYINISGPDCHYVAEVKQCISNVRIDISKYVYRYTVKEVD